LDLQKAAVDKLLVKGKTGSFATIAAAAATCHAVVIKVKEGDAVKL